MFKSSRNYNISNGDDDKSMSRAVVCGWRWIEFSAPFMSLACCFMIYHVRRFGGAKSL